MSDSWDSGGAEGRASVQDTLSAPTSFDIEDKVEIPDIANLRITPPSPPPESIPARAPSHLSPAAAHQSHVNPYTNGSGPHHSATTVEPPLPPPSTSVPAKPENGWAVPTSSKSTATFPPPPPNGSGVPSWAPPRQQAARQDGPSYYGGAARQSYTGPTGGNEIPLTRNKWVKASHGSK
ncbi:MAG: hypothetical protein CYPHOPRED_003729 [Cyphobasidiales sp. Tagirdzhanova-0007]|nr:MAG: hypothetical protein CYPHOPRED_003729 [Cyphobasidiales sp. Tagirdzhanova-0007]